MSYLQEDLQFPQNHPREVQSQNRLTAYHRCQYHTTPADFHQYLLPAYPRPDCPHLHYIPLKTSTGIVRLLISNIVFVEVQNHLVTFKLADGTFHTACGRLADYEKKLLISGSFFKPHRSYLINPHQVTGLNKNGFSTNTGKIVPVSRDAYTKAKSAYMNYLLNGRLEENAE